ncbi:MAG TPA: hypothetical protein VH186_15245 [Chloroflexia bacterium]|nr:hypothetical protein [Chloroflexia bacterium]
MQEEVCLLNIGPKQRQKRFNFGLIMLAIGNAGAVLLLFNGFSRWLRLFLFVPFTLAGMGIFQAREKT